MEVIFEPAKNGNLTCKYLESGNWKYLYSKYSPEKVQVQFQIDDFCQSILLLGVGLGYELNELLRTTNKKVYVVELEHSFLNLYHNISSDQVEFIDFKRAMELAKKQYMQIIFLKHITQLHQEKYDEIVQQYNSIMAINKRKIIWVIRSTLISKDCAMIFEKLGFQVEEIILDQLHRLHFTSYSKPEFIFQVNFNESVAQIAELTNIKYIAWCCDSPWYSLYSNNMKKYSNSLVFHFDKGDVEMLQAKGIENIKYLPMAANLDRIDAIKLSQEELIKYNNDLSFIGAPGDINQFKLEILPNMNDSMRNDFEQLVNEQMRYNKFIIPERLTKPMIDEIIRIKPNLATECELLTRESMMATVVGKYQAHRERVILFNTLMESQQLKLYGGEDWLPYLHKGNERFLMGTVEYETESFKVMKASKISMNHTRSYFNEAVPLRIFDILASKSLCITNETSGLSKVFIPGKHIVTYRDIQDLQEIISYYLMHEDERLEIITMGYQYVKENHSLMIRIQEMMKQIDNYFNKL